MMLSITIILCCVIGNNLVFGFSQGISENILSMEAGVNIQDQNKAVQKLIRRIIADKAKNFLVQIDPTIGPPEKDTFRLLKTDNKIKIYGTSGVAAATGFNYYLKYVLKSQISWEGKQISIPLVFPYIDLIKTSNDKFRYYQNVCTSSYSFVWWDWKQWEKHIDWMAMNSFNLVLAFNGQEAIWDRVYRKFNLTQSDIDEHFSGPAFLAWNRMGNLRAWGGPLSKSWHTRSLVLQKKIVNRMRELGMFTILPAFNGQVPRAFYRLYPHAKYYTLPDWNNFSGIYGPPYFLDPMEPLFSLIGKQFMSELIKEFGTDHLYNCDIFNEMLPFTTDPITIKTIGAKVYNTITESDPKAIWVMQGWLFFHDIIYWTSERAEALLTSVETGKMIVLDLQSEQFPQYNRLQSYFGQPFIWCMLHNFGGTLGMFGASQFINQGPFEARINSTMIGTGITAEGIDQNYVIYELMSEMGFRDVPVVLQEWYNSYAERRYGSNNAMMKKAWDVLRQTTYNFRNTFRMKGKYAFNSSPKTKINTWTWYEPCKLFRAWDYFILSTDSFQSSEHFRYDLVDLTRQILQDYGDELYDDMIESFKLERGEIFQRNKLKFLELFDDIDRILGTNKRFMLGTWLKAARDAANDMEEAKLFEFNAKNQITLWGPNGQIKDYANKQWSGIVSQYFKPRWQLFLDIMTESIIRNIPFKESEAIREVFNQVEEPFMYEKTNYPIEPKGDTILTAKELYMKYRKRQGLCRDY